MLVVIIIIKMKLKAEVKEKNCSLIFGFAPNLKDVDSDIDWDICDYFGVYLG